MGEVDDDNNNEEGGSNDLVFHDDHTLNWVIVYEASSIGEQIVYTRRQATNKRVLLLDLPILLRKVQV